MKKVVIIGAGLTGLSCAWHLGSNWTYEIYEKEKTAGGLCRTIEQDGFLFDFTGHLLHFKRPEIQKLVFTLLKKNYIKHNRNSWIYSCDTFTRYPFQANTYGLPLAVRRECVLEFIKTCIDKSGSKTNKTHSPQSFYHWVIQHFGRGIGKHFLFNYNEKLWTVDRHTLTDEWTGPYVCKPTPAEVLSGALTDQRKTFGYNASFWYPLKGGIQSLSSGLVCQLSSLFLEEEATEIDVQRKTVLFTSGKTVRYDTLVSTMSLTDLVGISSGISPEIKSAARKLRYNAVLNINLGITPALKTNKHWIYFPEKKYPFYRVGISSNFTRYNHPPDTSSLYIEIAYRPGKIDVGDEKTIKGITNTCVQKLRSIGLLEAKSKVITVCVLPVKPAYCIYDRQRTKNLKLIQGYLQKQHIYSIGRYGSWEYSAMEDALFWGKITAEKIKIQ